MTAGEPGGLGEEAARLVEALAGWAAQWTGSSLGERIATGAPECQVCPMCLLLRMVRGARPETMEHLLDAAGSLSAALRSALVEHQRHWAARGGQPVEHIVVD